MLIKPIDKNCIVHLVTDGGVEVVTFADLEKMVHDRRTAVGTVKSIEAPEVGEAVQPVQPTIEIPYGKKLNVATGEYEPFLPGPVPPEFGGPLVNTWVNPATGIVEDLPPEAVVDMDPHTEPVMSVPVVPEPLIEDEEDDEE